MRPGLLRSVLALFVLLAPGVVCEAQVAGLEKPNVIFIVVDDLNDYVGYLGRPSPVFHPEHRQTGGARDRLHQCLLQRAAMRAFAGELFDGQGAGQHRRLPRQRLRQERFPRKLRHGSGPLHPPAAAQGFGRLLYDGRQQGLPRQEPRAGNHRHRLRHARQPLRRSRRIVEPRHRPAKRAQGAASRYDGNLRLRGFPVGLLRRHPRAHRDRCEGHRLGPALPQGLLPAPGALLRQAFLPRTRPDEAPHAVQRPEEVRAGVLVTRFLPVPLRPSLQRAAECFSAERRDHAAGARLGLGGL